MITLKEVNAMIESELSRVNKLIKLTNKAEKLSKSANDYIKQLIELRQLVNTATAILSKCNNDLMQLEKEPTTNNLNVIFNVQHEITNLLVMLDHVVNSIKPSNTSSRYMNIYKAFINAYHYEADEIFTKARALMYKCTYYSYEQSKKKNNTVKKLSKFS